MGDAKRNCAGLSERISFTRSRAEEGVNERSALQRHVVVLYVLARTRWPEESRRMLYRMRPKAFSCRGWVGRVRCEGHV